MHLTHVANAIHDLAHGNDEARSAAESALVALGSRMDQLKPLSDSFEYALDARKCVQGIDGASAKAVTEFCEDLELLAACCDLQAVSNKIAHWLFLNGQHFSGGCVHRKNVTRSKRFEISATYSPNHWATVTVSLCELAAENVSGKRIIVGTEDGSVASVQIFNVAGVAVGDCFNSAAGFAFIAAMLDLMLEGYMREVA